MLHAVLYSQCYFNYKRLLFFYSDHEYEIIEKPPPNIIYTSPSVDEKPIQLVKADDELSSTTSLERKYLQHASDEEEEQLDENLHLNDDKNEEMISAEALQRDIEDRYFVNTPSSTSRTECEVSTSQVDSSALEQLPLKRDSRSKNAESTDSKIQQRIKEGTGKLKSQAGKLKSKLQSIKSKQFNMSEKPKSERPKFKMPQRPKISLPDRPKFSLPDRRKFSLPDRPKFKIAEKLNRSKFTLPDRPKFSVPDLPKFRMPDRPKINFPSLGRKKEYNVDTESTETKTEPTHVATVEFETRTYPRLFNRKKKSEIAKTSSSPTLNREDTPPPTFTFTRVKKHKDEPAFIPDSPEEPREYGNMEEPREYGNNDDSNFEIENNRQIETTYDFDKVDNEYMDDEPEPSHLEDERNASSIPDISPSKQEYTHVITEINNDEFFVRPRGISREDIQAREYLSDETRKAFQTPKNILSLIGNNSVMNDDNMYVNDQDADPELMIDDNEPMRYSTEDLNDKDDGYYTFPPVRPSRAKRKKKAEDLTPYMDDSVNASMQFSEVDLGLAEDHQDEHINCDVEDNINMPINNHLDFTPTTDLHSIHEYANDDVIQYPDNVPIQSQTLPMPPKRKKKFNKKDLKHSSLSDFNNVAPSELWEQPQEHGNTDDVSITFYSITYYLET